MNHSNHKEQHQHHNHEEISYFLPDHIILHLNHPIDYPADKLASDLDNFLRQGGKYPPWTERISPSESYSFLTFPFSTEGFQHSFVRVFIKDGTRQEDVGRLLSDIFSDTRGQPIVIRDIEGQQVSIVSATANWLAGGGSHGIGLPGPGAWPEKADIVPDGGYSFIEGTEIKNGESGDGSGINIAILDTAPCISDIDMAYEKWRNPTEHLHPYVKGKNYLIDRLLHPRYGKLNVYPATLEEHRLAAPYIVFGHPYSLADHGLFVAGIIHSFAPHADLHLFEVLHPNGVGCVWNILVGLLKALELHTYKNPLIINCSLVLGLPREGSGSDDFHLLFGHHGFPSGLSNYLTHFMLQIFDLLARENIVVVAAAGNDAQGTPGVANPSNRPPSRYPAALKDVIGVGALQRFTGDQVKIASYSNLACDPGMDGYVTFGGEEGKTGGMRGLYINPFPEYAGPEPRPRRGVRSTQVNYLPNDTGWAWWAGTSFAAPVITGLLAKWWNAGDDNGITRAKSILSKFTVSPDTYAGEKVISVHQQEVPV
jgi:hypothetical protein